LVRLAWTQKEASDNQKDNVMCWSITASILMVGAGSAATAVAAVRHQPAAITFALGYFTVMEALQAGGYLVVDQCGSHMNQSITLLSYLHIVFQPFVINAFAMELVPRPVQERVRRVAYLMCSISAVVMLMQLYPFTWAGICRSGDVLCGQALCLVSGEWHIAWNIPYNDLLVPFDRMLGTSFAFPTYVATVFALPLLYGAWRFVAIHLAAGPIFAGLLTSNPNEWPAVWCLFSIGILLMGLSPWIRGHFETRNWWLWPKSWTAKFS